MRALIDVEMIKDEAQETDALYWIPLPRTGCHLAISRRELMDSLPDSVVIKALRRGKYIARARQRREREKKRLHQAVSCDR